MAINIHLLLEDYDETEERERGYILLIERFLDSVLQIGNNISWSDCDSANSIQTLLDAVNGNYNQTIAKARKIIKKTNILVNHQIYSETYETELKQAIDDFSDLLGKIHPYFTVNIPLYNKMDYYGKSFMVTPAQILFMYQMVHKVVRDYCGKYYSINTIALENNIVYMTSRIIYCMFHGKERDWTYSFIKKQINYYLIHDIKEFYQFFMNTDQIMDHSIDIIQLALNSFKNILKILSTQTDKNKNIPYSMIKRLYILGFKNAVNCVKWEFERCEHPINSSLYDYKLLSIKDYDYSQLIESPKRYRFFSFEQMIFLYIGYLFYNKKKKKKCDNCGKFFIAKKSKQIYCDNPLKDNPEKTCRDVGAINKRDKKYGTDEVLKLNKNVQKNMSRLKGFCKDDVDEKFIEIIYGFWKNHYALVDKSNTDILLYLKDLYQILSFSINKYIFLYYKKLEKHDFYDLKKQAENCFGRIADHDNELFRAMCNYWRNKVVNLIGESLDKIFPEFAKHESEKTPLVSDEIMKENIEQTLERIVKVHDKAVEIYEKFINTDYDISEVEKVLKENL